MQKQKNKTGPNVTTRLSKKNSAIKKPDLSDLNQKKSDKVRSTSNSKTRKSSHEVAKSRRAKKIELRKREKRTYTAQDWAAPAPSNLVAKLDMPKVKTKYQSYFEFADNPEKKEKKLEFKVTHIIHPPPGYIFVPIGDPALTNACKEISREKDAMIFIVSTCKEDQSKISEHIYRVGFHIRETILQEACEFLGESNHYNSGSKKFIEPIPESQEEINKQADAAIRDLFPRIPNTDRQMVIEHAFKKGAMYQGEPTVGNQSNIPLSRRVQLAVLAHIRHKHTRYDQLLRETSWMNARKVVEPVCLDIILKWRGNEENGRDQMDEILREVVIITDSESEDEVIVITDSESENEDNQLSSQLASSDEEGEVASRILSEHISRWSPSSKIQYLGPDPMRFTGGLSPEHTSDRLHSVGSQTNFAIRKPKDKRVHRGFKRYQAAWEEALQRQHEPTPCVNYFKPHRNLSATQHSMNILDPYPGNFTNNPSLSDSTYLKSYDNPDSTRRAKDSYYIIPSTHPIYRGPLPGMSSGRRQVIDNPHLERPFHFRDSTYETGIHKNHRQGQVSPNEVAEHVLQDKLVESIETPSNENISPREERYVSARFNHIQYSYPPQSRWLRYQSPTRHPLIVIDDNSPQAGSRYILRNHAPSHSRHFPSCMQGDFEASRNFDCHLNPVLSAQTRDCISHRSKAFECAKDISQNSRSTHLDPVCTTEISACNDHTPVYFPSQAGDQRRVDVNQMAKSLIEPVDLTSQELSPDREVYSCRPVKQPCLGEYQRVTGQNHYARFPNEYHKNYSFPSVPPISHDMVSYVGINQDLNTEHTYCQPDDRDMRVENSLKLLTNRYAQGWAAQHIHPEFIHNSVMFATPPITRDRSPVHFVERRRYASDQHHKILHYS